MDNKVVKQEECFSINIKVSPCSRFIDISQVSIGGIFGEVQVDRKGAPELIKALHEFMGGDAEPKLQKGDHAVWLKSHSRSSEVFKIDTDKSGKVGMRPASKKEIEQGFRDEN